MRLRLPAAFTLPSTQAARGRLPVRVTVKVQVDIQKLRHAGGPESLELDCRGPRVAVQRNRGPCPVPCKDAAVRGSLLAQAPRDAVIPVNLLGYLTSTWGFGNE